MISQGRGTLAFATNEDHHTTHHTRYSPESAVRDSRVTSAGGLPLQPWISCFSLRSQAIQFSLGWSRKHASTQPSLVNQEGCSQRFPGSRTMWRRNHTPEYFLRRHHNAHFSATSPTPTPTSSSTSPPLIPPPSPPPVPTETDTVNTNPQPWLSLYSVASTTHFPSEARGTLSLICGLS